MKAKLKYILWGLLILFLVAQIFRIDRVNPPISDSENFEQLEISDSEAFPLLRDACYDCHSNETKFPWYTHISPLSHWIKGHIDHGRRKLNFSTWGTYDREKRIHKLEECIEEIESNKMPLKSYKFTHPESRLSESQKVKLVEYLQEIKVRQS